MSKSASAIAWARIPGVSNIPPCRFAKRPSLPAPAPSAAWGTRSPSKAAANGAGGYWTGASALPSECGRPAPMRAGADDSCPQAFAMLRSTAHHLTIGRVGQFLHVLMRDLAGQGIAEIAVDPVEHLDTVFGDVAERRLAIARHGTPHIECDALPARILVHELCHRAGFTCQQAPAQQFETERTEFRRLDRYAAALGKPAHQMRDVGRIHLDRLQRLGTEDRMRDRRIAGEMQRHRDGLVLPEADAVADQAADGQGKRRSHRPPWRADRPAPRRTHQLDRQGLVEHAIDRGMQRLVLSGPCLYPRGVLRMRSQPGLA